ncbi:MAG: tetratricopeptide repeat protein [Planctomycetota bacterium]
MADDWTRVNDILAEALERPEAQRAAFVSEACGDDKTLRAQVERLIALDGQAAAFVGGHPDAISENAEAAAPAVDRIGHYTVRRVIASGGMGTVYEAEQDHPSRLVALKVLRHGAASPQALKRFQHESEILGRLKHANIAQVYEAGTWDRGEGAQPYFAMELIEGQPLLRYAESGKLGLRPRLELFVKVCDAVQYAHQRGVIHRDLKPDNVLVDAHGEPKILDFGVARATDSDIRTTTLQTDIGQLIGTVPYMSPEQVMGDPHGLDTRSDVYSLGVVLYELMCGKLPYDLTDKSIPEAVLVIRGEDPVPLSTINRTYRGDLETIAGKALEKDKDRRYQTAAELAADVRRYLTDEPIVARPPSTFYQLRKFARRNKALVGGVAVAMIALMLGTVASTWQAVLARNEAAKQAATNEFMMRLFALANPIEDADELAELTGHERVLTLEELLLQASEDLKTAFPEHPEVRAELQYRLGKTFWGMSRFDEMGDNLRSAYKLRRELLGERHEDTLETLIWWAYWFSDQGDSENYLRLERQAFEGLRQVCGEADPRTLMAATETAVALASVGRFEDSDELFRETIEISRRNHGDDHRITLKAVIQRGYTLTLMGRHAENERMTRAALEVSRRRFPEGDVLTSNLAYRLGVALERQRRYAEALERYRETFAWENRDGASTAATAIRTTVSMALVLRRLERAPDGEELLRKQLDACREQLGDNHEYVAWSEWALGVHLREVKRPGDAEEVLRRSHDHFSRVLGSDNYWVLFGTRELAKALRDRGKPDEAEPLFRQAVDGWLNLKNYPNATGTLLDLGLMLTATDRAAEGAAVLRQYVEVNTQMYGNDDRMTYQAMNRLAWNLKDLGEQERAEAASIARKAWEGQRRVLGPEANATLMTADTLAVILSMQGHTEEAVSMFDEIIPARRRLHGENRWFLYSSPARYGRDLTRLRRFDDAESLLIAAYEGLESSEDDAADKLAEVRDALVGLYIVWGRREMADKYRAPSGVMGSD